MDAIEGLSLTTVLVAINGWLAILAKHRYARWIERRKFRHFRILIIGRVIRELDNIWESVLNGDEHKPVVRTSDLVVTALVDAGFVSTEIPRVFTQACQDTRGRFGGLIGKLSQQFFDSRFIVAVETFFEPDIRFGGNDGASDVTESK